MGLAASQARLLFITSRQNDVSAQMQRVSNQNLVLARDEEEVSETYNRMLSATTLVTADGNDINYDQLMGTAGAESGLSAASVVMKGDKIALSSSLVTTFGLPASGNAGDITKIYPTAKDFVKKVTGSDEIANAIKVDSAGGTTPQGGVLTSDQQAKLKTFKSSYGSYPTATTSQEVQQMLSGAKANISTWKKTNNDNVASSYNLLDLINGDANGDIIINLADDNSAKGAPTSEAKANVQNISKSIIDAIAKAMGITNTTQVQASMKNIVDNLVNNVDQLNDSGNRASKYNDAGPKTDNALRDHSNENLNGLIARGCASKGTDRDFWKINATTLTKYLFAAMMNLYGNSNEDIKTGVGAIRGNELSDSDKALVDFYARLGSDVSGTGATYDIVGMKFDLNQFVNYTTNEKGYSEEEYQKKLASFMGTAVTEEMLTYLGKTKVVAGNDSNNVTNKTTAASKASYYQSIYDKLNAYGWVTDDLVTNSSKFTEALKNGTYTINGTTATNSGMFEEKTDTDARAKAEHYYDDEMRKINRKEKQLDQQMTKLQTEYSALTNDYNSVKSLLDANIQRSFTYCGNG